MKNIINKLISVIFIVCLLCIVPSKIAATETEYFQITDYAIDIVDDKIHFEFQIDDTNAQGKSFTGISVYYDKDHTESQNFYLMNDGEELKFNETNQKYEATLEKDFSSNGVWKFNSINIMSETGEMLGSVIRSTDYDQLDKSDLTIQDVVTYQAPVIKSMSLVNDPLKAIPAGQYLKMNIDVETKEVSTYIDLIYLNKKTGNAKYLSAIYDERLKQYIVTLEPKMMYEGDAFQFLCVRAYSSGEKHYNTNTEFAIYSPYSEDELKTYQSILDEVTSISKNFQYHYSVKTIQNMDILLTYKVDTHVPCIENSDVKWKEKTIIQPNLATLEFKVDDFGESGIERVIVVYKLDGKVKSENVTADVTGIIPDHSVLNVDIPIPRYSDAQNTFQIMGIVLQDYSEKYHLYHTSEDYVDTIYDYVNMDNANDIEFDEIQIEKLQFKAFQQFDKMLNSSSSQFLDQVQELKEGEVGVVNYSHRSTISKDVFESIQGKDITLIFEAIGDQSDDGVQWVINGKDIHQPKSIDLATEIIYRNEKVDNEDNQIVDLVYSEFLSVETANQKFIEKIKSQDGTDYYVEYLSQFNIKTDNFYEKLVLEYMKYERAELKFRSNGELPGKMLIRYNPNYTFRGYVRDKKLNCYYVDGKQYELIKSDISATLDNCYEFDITHNSTYVLTTEDLIKDNSTSENDSITNPQPDETPLTNLQPNQNLDNKDIHNNQVQTDDLTNIYSYFVCMFIAAGMIFLSYKKYNQ